MKARDAVEQEKLQGRLVVLEGLDGSGTSTLAAAMGRELTAEGRSVLVTEQPSAGQVGSLIRKALHGEVCLSRGRRFSATTLAELYAADRQDHQSRVILPGLATGHCVISTRGVLSSLAYQGPELGYEEVCKLNEDFRSADLTLFVRVSLATSERRRHGSGRTEDFMEKRSFQQRVEWGYEAALSRWGSRENVVILDGERSPEEVLSMALWHVRRLLAGKARG